MANGTTCLLESVRLIQGADVEPMTLDGFWVNSVRMSDVESIQCKFDGGFRSGVFTLKPKTQTCTMQMPCTLVPGRDHMSVTNTMTQFPFLINKATTGHKLQGKHYICYPYRIGTMPKTGPMSFYQGCELSWDCICETPFPEHYVFTPPPAMIAMRLQFEENTRQWDFVRREVHFPAQIGCPDETD
jgi:hypothetical protein